MSDSRPYPRLETFERLHISDGMAIDADRWQQAHRYHRQRQNFHYQALQQPGIVKGLGVTVVADQPDGRVLQIQPGIAIDVEGNPIIVKQPEEFRIMSEAPEGQSLMVHIAVNYVDPDDLRHPPTQHTVVENFRIVEKLHLDPHDVELCRIALLPSATQIQVPLNVFSPGPNQLDFRGRRSPRPYFQGQVQVGQIIRDRPADIAIGQGLTDLLRSLDGLYPALNGSPSIKTFPAKGLGQHDALDCHLIYVSYEILKTLPNPALQQLQTYLAQGGVLLVGADFAEVNLLDWLDLGQELQSGLTEARRDVDLLAQMGQQLQTEIAANQQAIQHQLAELEQPLQAIAPQLGLDLSGSGELDHDHPLRWQPFTFSQWPKRQGHTIYLKNWGGLVWMVGDLSRSWGRNAQPDLPRDALRSAQEWGINLLSFAVQRQQWHQAMQQLPAPQPDNRPDSLRGRVQTT
jgi:hypothetical protein